MGGVIKYLPNIIFGKCSLFSGVITAALFNIMSSNVFVSNKNFRK